jgi:hypothetical protein
VVNSLLPSSGCGSAALDLSGSSGLRFCGE